MKNYFRFDDNGFIIIFFQIIILSIVSLSVSNDYYETYAQTAPFFLKAGNSASPAAIKKINDQRQPSLAPTIFSKRYSNKISLITFQIPDFFQGMYTLEIFDIRGRNIRTITNNIAISRRIMISITNGSYIFRVCYNKSSFSQILIIN